MSRTESSRSPWAAPALAAHFSRKRSRVPQILQAAPDRAPRDLRRTRDRRDPAVARSLRLRRRAQPPATLIKRGANGFKSNTERQFVYHRPGIALASQTGIRQTFRLSEPQNRFTCFWASPWKRPIVRPKKQTKLSVPRAVTRKYANADADWRAASEDHLFVRKRAETLAELLDAKRAFQSLNWNHSGPDLLRQLLSHPNGLRTINAALVEVRKAGLSSQVADVSVCGAVAPYNALLGGKLVALLMMAQEVRDAYRRRYSAQASLISSQMAGRPIFRPAELKFLTTTSLYGNGSSQYNRLRLRREDFPQLEHDIMWQELAQTAGYGTVHLQAATVQVLREYSERTHGARRINNRFGEGASPRLRQVREAMDALGINSSSILHNASRVSSTVASCIPALARNCSASRL